MRGLSAIAAALCLGLPILAAGEENSDLDLIPNTVIGGGKAAPAPSETAGVPAAPAHGKFYLENAVTGASPRNLLVPLPPPALPNWQNRTSLDALGRWPVADRLSVSFSDRFNLIEESDFDIISRQTLRNDFREGYLTWEPITRTYLEAGRINLRNGVALGFNPTDFFKTRTGVSQASLDPSVIREDRLGTVMARGEAIWDKASATLAFAPRLTSPTPIAEPSRLGLDPLIDHTNSANRFLASASYDIADLSPQALIYRESNQTKFGLNLSHPLGESIIAYGEWAGGKQRNLIADAIAYGKETAVLPKSAPILPPTDPAAHFRSDLALGASWTPRPKLTVNAEYHFHEAGFTARDWRNWFAIGGANTRAAPVASELWYVRGFANAQQEPVTRQEAFLRADWTDAFVTDLELTAIAFVDLYDGSTLTQLTAKYYLSDRWTIGGYLGGNLGGKRSEHGSFPQAATATLQLDRYF